MRLELFYSPYCPHCRSARRQLRALVAALTWQQLELLELDVVKEIDRAVALGVLRTPALAIDGELMTGPIPSPKALESILRRRLIP
jgi:protein-disulfide isomerase